MTVGREVELELKGSNLLESLRRKMALDSGEKVARREVKRLVSIQQSDDFFIPIYH